MTFFVQQILPDLLLRDLNKTVKRLLSCKGLSKSSMNFVPIVQQIAVRETMQNFCKICQGVRLRERTLWHLG